MPPEPAEQNTSQLAAAPTATHRTILSFPVFLCFGLMVLAVLVVRSRFNDPDLWWHLRMGQVIWTTHQIPSTDLFSFTAGGHAWTPHEWLAELTIYAAYRLAGYSGLMLWLCVSASALLVLVYVLCALYGGDSKIAFLGALVGWLFATVGLAVRPLMIGHIFLAAELTFLHLARSRNHRWLMALPPLFALWANCHSSYSLGLLVLGIVLVCSHLRVQAGLLTCTPWPPEARRLFGWVFGLSLAAMLANPVGPRLLLYPLNVFTSQREALAAVDEWLPLTVTEPRGLMLFGVAGFVFLMVLMKKTSLRLDEVLLLGLGFGIALQHRRLVFAFGILAAPVICRLLTATWGAVERKREHPFINAVFILACIAIMAYAFPDRANLESQVRAGSPTGAVSYIRRTGLTGRMANDYTWGGYLIWALPEQKVFIDGRADVFEWTGVLHEYALWATLQQDPQVLLDKYHIDYCLLRADAPTSAILRYLPGWEKAYGDGQAVIFIRKKRG